VNLQEYIASGILELYVLGELTEQERSDVEKNLARYPELREELARVEETQEKLLLSAAIKPRASVKTDLFKRIESKPEAKVVSIQKTDSSLVFWKFAAAAAVAVAVMASYFAYDFHSRWKSSENNLADLIAQNGRMALEYNQVNQKIDQIQNELKITSSPAFNRVIMVGTPNSPEALASVYWNQNTKEVYLSLQNMKELSQENQYQLWALIDGKPVDAGVFDGNVAGLIRMKDIPAGAGTFAVTIERRGGVPSPTLSTMQVAGNVKS
jgi:anti-sigma-K factor RskA